MAREMEMGIEMERRGDAKGRWRKRDK